MGATADTSNALVTAADAAMFLGEATSSTLLMDALRDVIDYVSHRCNAETGRRLKARSYTEYYNGNGRTWMYLSNWPLSSTTITITIDGSRAYTTDYQVPSTDIILTTESGLVELDGYSFDPGRKAVKVVYSAGYTTDAELDLVYTAKEYVKFMWDRRDGKRPIDLRGESFEGVTRTYENDLPWSVRKVLEMYRERPMG